MGIRRRVKINVQSSGDEGTTIDAKKLNRAKLSLFRDDEEDDDFDVTPTRVLKKKKDQPARELPSVEDSHISYEDLFTGKSALNRGQERVLNLEDMDQEGSLPQEEDDESGDKTTGIASREEIEEIKRRRLKLKQAQDKISKEDEKVYVSLLDKEDKLEIMDTIKRQGGQEEDQNEPDDPEPDLLDDGKLPLSSREILMNQSNRKRAIEEAIKLQDEEASDAWETQMMSKGSGQSRPQAAIPVLPRLYANESDESDELSQAIASVTLRKSQLEKQLKVLKAQRAEYQQQQDTFTHRMCQWSQA